MLSRYCGAVGIGQLFKDLFVLLMTLTAINFIFASGFMLLVATPQEAQTIAAWFQAMGVIFVIVASFKVASNQRKDSINRQRNGEINAALHRMSYAQQVITWNAVGLSIAIKHLNRKWIAHGDIAFIATCRSLLLELPLEHYVDSGAATSLAAVRAHLHKLGDSYGYVEGQRSESLPKIKNLEILGAWLIKSSEEIEARVDELTVELGEIGYFRVTNIHRVGDWKFAHDWRSELLDKSNMPPGKDEGTTPI